MTPYNESDSLWVKASLFSFLKHHSSNRSADFLLSIVGGALTLNESSESTCSRAASTSSFS